MLLFASDRNCLYHYCGCLSLSEVVLLVCAVSESQLSKNSLTMRKKTFVQDETDTHWT